METDTIVYPTGFSFFLLVGPVLAGIFGMAIIAMRDSSRAYYPMIPLAIGMVVTAFFVGLMASGVLVSETYIERTKVFEAIDNGSCEDLKLLAQNATQYKEDIALAIVSRCL